MLFRYVNENVAPMAPEIREPDGLRTLSLEQAAELTGRPVEDLRKEWLDTWGSLLPQTELDGTPLLTAERPEPMAVLWSEMTEARRDELTREALYPQLDAHWFQVFKGVCIERRFSLFCKHLYPEIRREDKGEAKLQVITTIEALLITAERTGKFRGPGDIEWCDADGNWRDVWLGGKETPPTAARASVFREGHDGPVKRIAHWESYVPLLNEGTDEETIDPFWFKHAPGQLGKCALALSLRHAFPHELSGLYSMEEMAQARAKDRENARRFKGPRLAGEQPAPPEDDRDPEELDPVEEEDFKELLDSVYPRSSDAERFITICRTKYSQLWKSTSSRYLFYRCVARDLRDLKRRSA